jgi:hypothetical protein
MVNINNEFFREIFPPYEYSLPHCLRVTPFATREQLKTITFNIVYVSLWIADKNLKMFSIVSCFYLSIT